MAILYESGRGVERNPLRACGLFVQATKPANPFMAQASAVATAMRERSGLAATFCTPGQWHSLPPMSFTLGPSIGSTSGVRLHHSLQRVRAAHFRFEPAGYVPVAPRYTPLDVSRPVAARRHFLEQLVWAPDVPDKPSMWTLWWMLREVVGGETLLVTSDRNLAMVAGTQPPAAFDLASVVRVRVNANGEAEWQIIGGPNPRSGVIPARDPR